MQISNKSHQYKNTWSHKIDRWSDAPPVIGTSDDVFVTGIQHRLYNLNLETGTLNWQTDVGDLLYSPPLKATEETLLINSHGAERELLIGVDSTNGKVKWSHRQNRWAQMDIAGRTAYSLLGPGFSSIDIDSGRLNWSIPVESVARSEPVIGPKGRVYLCEDDPTHGHLRTFSKLNSQTGAKEWSIFSDESAVSFSTEGFLGVRHHKYDDNFEVIANQFEIHDPESGEKLWILDRIGWNYTTQFLDDSLLVKSFEDYSDAYHTLESRDVHTGDLNWSTQLPPVGDFKSTSNGLIVGKSTKANPESGERYGHDLIALNPKTGKKSWNFVLFIDDWQGLHVKESGVYVSGRKNIGDTDRYRSILFAVDQETGEKKWEYDAGLDHRQLIEDPEAGRLYLSVGENKMVCLDAESGTPLWHIKSDIALEISKELTPDGRVLITDLDGNVAALSQDSPLAIPGDVPEESEKDHGIPVVSRGYSAQHLMEGSKEILGSQREVILTDPENDGVAEGWEPVLVRDTNDDGQITNEDLATLPNRSFLQSLDTDDNGILVGPELEDQSLAWWGDRDENGEIGDEDYFRDQEERLIDLERLHETVRY